MLKIVPSNQFKRDLKLAKKRGYVFLFRTGTHSDLF